VLQDSDMTVLLQLICDTEVPAACPLMALHCNFLRWNFQPFGLNLVLPSVVKPSGGIVERGKRQPT